MWNEEGYIERCVAFADETGRYLVRSGEVSDYEILIINDASTDATRRIAEELAVSNSRLRVIHHDMNRGLGGGLKTGFSAAKGDLVFYNDADLPFDLFELRRACRMLRMQEADIVCGCRLNRRVEGLQRMVYTVLYNALVRALFGVRFSDVNTPFKLCRRRIFERVRLESEGSFIDAELLVKSEREGYKVLEIWLNYFPRTRGISTLASPRVIRGIVGDLWNFWSSGSVRR